MSYNLEIISATYGTNIVTIQARKAYSDFVNSDDDDARSNIFKITPDDYKFGPDPSGGEHKNMFVMVWRVPLPDKSNTTSSRLLYSAFQITRGVQDKELEIDYDGSKLSPAKAPTSTGGGIYLVDASYYDKDVTADVENTISTTSSDKKAVAISVPPTGYSVTTAYKSQLSVTYGYLLEDGQYQYNVKAAWDGAVIYINKGPAPPRLLIKAANFGGVDFTRQVQALITFDQCLTLDMSHWARLYNWASPQSDAAYGKTMSILYQWSDRPLELLMAADGSGISELDPTAEVDPARTLFFNPNGRIAGELNIIAIIWGRMEGQTVAGPVGDAVFQYVKNYAMIPTPTAALFSFVGWKGKTPCAQVFYQYGIGGTIQCASAWQNGSSVSLAPQPASFDDPFRSGALLEATDGTSAAAFRLRDPRSQLYFTYVKDTGLSASTTDTSKASTFTIDISTGRPLLARKDRSTTSYATIGKNENVVDFTTDYKRAMEFRYELPGNYATLFLVMSFTQTKSNSIPVVFSAYKPDDTLIRAVPIHRYQIDKVKIPTDANIFQFEWVTKVVRSSNEQKFSLPSNEQSFPIPSNEQKSSIICTRSHFTHMTNLSAAPAGPAAGLTFPFDSCTLAYFYLIKDFCWDLPTLMFGAPSVTATKVVNGVVAWWKSIPQAARDKVALLLTSLHINVQGAATPVLKDLWEDACKLIKGIHKADVLWSLYKSIASDFNWIDFGILCANLLKYILAGSTTGAGAAILYATDVALWALNVVKDGIAWVKVCIPKVSSAVNADIQRLAALVRAVVLVPAYAHLEHGERFDIITALLEPHFTRIITGKHGAPPNEHLGPSLPSHLEPPQFAHLPKFLEDAPKRSYLEAQRELSPAAKRIESQLRDEVEKKMKGKKWQTFEHSSFEGDGNPPRKLKERKGGFGG